VIKAISKVKLERKHIHDFIAVKHLCLFQTIGAVIKILYI